MTEIPDKPYFTASEVARLLLVSTNSVRVWANKGLLPFELTLGGHRRFARKDIERLVQERQATALPRPAGMRILVIDDDAAYCDILAQALVHAMPDTVVSVANDGFRGGMLAASTLPEAILLDLRMTGMDGFQTCRMLKADDTTRNIRVIAISGTIDAGDAQRIRDAGAEDLLAKPLDIPTLLQVLHRPAPAASG